MIHDHNGGACLFAPVIPVAALGYLALALRQRAKGRGWSWWRTTAFLSGSIVLASGLLPQYLPYPNGDFRKHMLQHLMVGMFAPLGLVMAAPVTLVLRTVPAAYGRFITRLLRTPLFQAIANPVTALTLNLGGLATLYFTPLYLVMTEHPALHNALHLHFLAAGCLFTWVIAGPDPAPHRLSVPARLVVLGVAVTVHSVLAQLLYAGAFVAVEAPPIQLQTGAELMYYGGDITEMLLAFALVTSWQPGRDRVARAA